jgi:hypothetical protein
MIDNLNDFDLRYNYRFTVEEDIEDIKKCIKILTYKDHSDKYFKLELV